MVGLGQVADVHLQAYRHTESVRVVSVCDVRQELAERIAATTGATAFANHRDLLDADGIDLVLVLAPARWHRAIVEDVASAGMHVFTEKPLAVTVDDARAMVSACARAGVKLFYGSCYRYLPAIVAARRLIDEGRLGQVQLLTERICGGDGLEGWTELGPSHYPIGGPGGHGMGLVDHGIHLIDIFPWLVRAEIVSVCGRGQRSGAPPVNEWMHMQLANGADAQLQYSLATFATDVPDRPCAEGRSVVEGDSPPAAGGWGTSSAAFHINGTRASLRVHYYANELYLFDRKGTHRFVLEDRPFPDHFRVQIEDCARAIREGAPAPIPGEAGVAALDALWRVYGSS